MLLVTYFVCHCCSKNCVSTREFVQSYSGSVRDIAWPVSIMKYEDESTMWKTSVTRRRDVSEKLQKPIIPSSYSSLQAGRKLPTKII
jgi:hypothetical protein